MADPELVQTLDYILNRCDEGAIEAVAAAVIRRRRNLALFGGSRQVPDPEKMAQELSAQVNIASGLEGLKDTVRNMAVRIIRQEAPELTDAQVDELTRAWVPSRKAAQSAGGGEDGGSEKQPPPDMLEAMVNQFVSYSFGRMPRAEDQNLRNAMGSWPERYWNAFPPVVRALLNDLIKGKITESEFNGKFRTASAL
jgi:hypothetical protein